MNYMTTHLLEAIVLNFKRMGRYASMSRGRSLVVSSMLIGSEVASLVTALFMDLRAKYWQKRGVPVFVHEFVEMDLTPAFSKTFPFDPVEVSNLPALDIEYKKVSGLISSGDYASLAVHLEDLIHRTTVCPHAYCMTRHTLESFLRAANLTPMHIQKAKELGVRSPEHFCRQNLSAHLIALGFCKLLDRIALPLQNEGIPIIYQDVPSIAPVPSTY